MKGQKIILSAIVSVVIVSLIFVLNYSSIYADESIVDVQLAVPQTNGFLNPFDTQKGIGGFGENVEVIISSHTPGHKGPVKDDKTFGDNRLKCSLSSVLKCTVINSADGLEEITLAKFGSLTTCDVTDTRDGSKRGSVDTRKTIEACVYVPFTPYQVDVDAVNEDPVSFCITSDATSLTINSGVCT